MRQLPHEEVVYIGDSARAPYGPRPADQIRDYTWEMVRFLLTKNVKDEIFRPISTFSPHLSNINFAAILLILV